MMLMVSANELLTAYISLELLSFCLYIMAAYAKREARSNEAGVKYILIGAFSSGVLLYGISLVYGALGTITFEGMADALRAGEYLELAFLTGLVLLIAGFGFKVVAVPFHMWAPDVYEGAPVPVTAYLSVASKAASFALLLRLFAIALEPAIDDWKPIVAAIAALTMTVGNVVAISQKNIKRLLAYSSIGHAGFLLVGIAALSEMASTALVLYLVGYAATTFVAFICVIIYFNLTGSEKIEEYAGLAKRSPVLALAMTISLFFPCWAALLCRLHDQVLHLRRRRQRRPYLARRHRRGQQPDLRLLLPHGHQADVHQARPEGSKSLTMPRNHRRSSPHPHRRRIPHRHLPPVHNRPHRKSNPEPIRLGIFCIGGESFVPVPA